MKLKRPCGLGSFVFPSDCTLALPCFPKLVFPYQAGYRCCPLFLTTSRIILLPAAPIPFFGLPAANLLFSFHTPQWHYLKLPIHHLKKFPPETKAATQNYMSLAHTSCQVQRKNIFLHQHRQVSCRRYLVYIL